MDELTLLRDLRADVPDLPAPAAGRQRLVRTATAPHTRGGGRTWKAVAATTGAAAVTAGVVVALQAGPGAAPSTAAVLSHAAKVVAEQPFTPPRPDQWLYEKVLGVDPLTGATGTHPGESWTKFDGTVYAESRNGQVQTEPLMPGQTTPLDRYRALEALPSDPHALLQALRDGALGGETGATQADRDFNGVTHALTLQTVVPPDVESDLFAALATIPGVGIDENAAPDLVGQPVLSVTYSGPSPIGAPKSRTELLLDPTTYAVLGIRETALEDTRLDKSQVIRAGTVWYNDTFLAETVVDQAGARS